MKIRVAVARKCFCDVIENKYWTVCPPIWKVKIVIKILYRKLVALYCIISTLSFVLITTNPYRAHEDSSGRNSSLESYPRVAHTSPGDTPG